MLAVAIGMGCVMVTPATATAQAADDEQILGGLDYQDAVARVPELLAQVPSFEPSVSFVEGDSKPYVAGETLPQFCSGKRVEVLGGYELRLSGPVGPDGNVSLSFTIAAIDNPKAWLKQVKRESAKCTEPYVSGSTTLTPAAKQPVLGYKPKLKAALETTSENSGNSIFQIAVRSNARSFVGYYTVAADNSSITDDDLEALAALASTPIGEMEQQFKRAVASTPADR